MKIAVVCDDLIQFGGQERLVIALLDLFPAATLYTSVLSFRWRRILREKRVDHKTSFIQYFPLIKYLNRYYSVFYSHIFGMEAFDLTTYDVVISISSRYSHFVTTKPQTKHICYMNSPGRMFWEPITYFEHETFGFLSFIKKIGDYFVQPFLSLMRISDRVASSKVDEYIANSVSIKNKITKYYSRNSCVIHPFVEYSRYKNVVTQKGDYFLVVTRLVSWKRVDLAIKACIKLGAKLKIVGKGPDMKRLKKMAKDKVEFMGGASDDEKIELLSGCLALINTQFEDFGIVPLEAMACGKPVIGYGNGGVLETVIEGKTGLFFKEQKVESLVKVLKKFNSDKFDPEECKNQAKKFRKKIFLNKIKKKVDVV